MTDPCACASPAGNAVDASPMSFAAAPTQAGTLCPVCRQVGKPVPGQTVKAMLAVSLRLVQDVDYFSCRTHDCPVVYYNHDGGDQFTIDQVRERVYHKAPEVASVFVCYCFRHTIGAVQTASIETRAAILADITDGIRAGQCACDLRNPQGVCCLGTIREHIKQIQQ